MSLRNLLRIASARRIQCLVGLGSQRSAGVAVEPLEDRTYFGIAQNRGPMQPTTCPNPNSPIQANPNSSSGSTGSGTGGSTSTGAIAAAFGPSPGNPTGAPGGGTSGGSGSGGAGGTCSTCNASQAPVVYATGMQLDDSTDLSSNAFGTPWGHTRSWTGLNESSQNGNGWTISQLPYLDLKQNQHSSHDAIIALVEGGNSALEFIVPPDGTAFNQRYADQGIFEYIPPITDGSSNKLPGEFHYTDTNGNVTAFYDVPRSDDTVLTDSNGKKYGRIAGANGYAQQVTQQWFNTSTGARSDTTSGATSKYRFGAFKSFTSASGGLVVTANYDSNGNLDSVDRTDGTAYERFDYTYATLTNSLGASAPLISKVELKNGASAGTLGSAIRSVEYEYYTGTESEDTKLYGRFGDLKLVTIKDASGATIDQKFYRYNKLYGKVFRSLTGYETNGPTNDPNTTGGTDTTYPQKLISNGDSWDDTVVTSGLKTVVEGAAFTRLAANRGSITTFQDDADAYISPYATFTFVHDRIDPGDSDYSSTNDLNTRYRVIEETASGEGCSTCSGGVGTFKFEYSLAESRLVNSYDDFDNTHDTNTWYMKTVEYLPDTTSGDWTDNDQNVVYTNELGQVMMKVLIDKNGTGEETSDDKAYPTYYRFDPQGRLVLQAQPSAMITYDPVDPYDYEIQSDLVGFDGTGYANITDDAGLVERTHYYTGWEFKPNSFSGSGIDANGGAFTGGNPNAPEGTQVAFIQGTGTIRQILPGWEAGSYTITVAAAKRSGYGNHDFQILIDGSVVGTITTTSTSYNDFTTSSFSVGAGIHTLEFLGVNTLGGDKTSFIDNVRINGTGAPFVGVKGFEKPTTNIFFYGGQTGFDTNAGTSTAGGVENYFMATSVQQGDLGTPVFQRSRNYFVRTAGGATVYPTASDTTYRNTDGTGPQTTSYAYTWRSGTTTAEQVEVTYPVVTSGQNGPGSTATETYVFDADRHLTWFKDADGYITRLSYDDETGAVDERIVDVNTATTSDEPSGWTTPTGGGLHLVSSMEIDDLGRTTKLTDPNGNVTYTVFKDAAHETRVYRGWQAATNAPTGPIEVTREYRPGVGASSGQRTVYTEFLTSSATPSVSSGRPTGTETIDEGNIQSLMRRITNDAGQMIEADSYFSMSGITYGQADAQLGSFSNDTSSGNYHRTLTDYDSRGRVKRTESSSGTITRYLYDARGLLLSTWVGSDDTPSSGFWSLSNTTGTNLAIVAANEYDAGGIGDGNLTKAMQFPDGQPDYIGVSANGSSTDPDRVMLMFYDWRNRLVVTKSGARLNSSGGNDTGNETADVQRQIKYCEFDNLGRQSACEWYDGDGVTVTSTDGVPNKPSSSLRRARSETYFDEQGRIYSTKTISVDQSTGALGNALVTNIWRDKRGNVIKNVALTGLVTKVQYDGAGRVAKMFSTDGGSDSGYGDADDVSGDKVLEQTEYMCDADGNVILTVVRRRFHDATDAGGLGDPSSNSGTAKARVSYSARYYDAANRLIADVDFGTNGGTLDGTGSGADLDANNNGIADRPATIPDRSDTVLVTNYFYGSEVQCITVSGVPTGGTFTLTCDGQTTSSIAYNASATTVQTALRALSNIGDNDVIVSGVAGGPYLVRFAYALGSANVAQLTASSSLTGGSSPGVTIATRSGGLDAGRLQAVVDPRDIESRTDYDLLGRKTKATDNFADGTAGSGDDAVDRITLYTYDGLNHIRTLTADLPTGQNNQTTEYVYGVSPTYSSAIYSNDLLRETRYPDPSAGTAGTTNADKERYTYNALGDAIAMTDRNQTVHAYTYDVLGRRLVDSITTLGSGVDGTIRRLETEYDTGGRAYRFTSAGIEQTASGITRGGSGNLTATVTLSAHGYQSGDTVTISGATPSAYNGTFIITVTSSSTFTYTMASDPGGNVSGAIVKRVVNQVQREFNGLGQMSTEYQEHAGAVSTGTSLKVQYAYDTTNSSGVLTKGSRLTSMIYPNGRILNYQYASGIDDNISRVSVLADESDSGPTGGHLEEYSYLGLGTVVERSQPIASLKLTYVDDGIGASTGDGGDQYVGLDRFGRIVDQNWVDFDAGDVTGVFDDFVYMYDRDGNRLTRAWSGDGSPGTIDEAYSYDGLNRLTKMNRGTLSSGTISDANALYTRRWDGTENSGLDALGNWRGVATDANGGTSGGVTQQTRTHDSRNQLSAIGANSVSADADGNLTANDSNGQSFTYDSWNHMTAYDGSDSGGYAYDALGRRIVEDGASTRHMFYSAGWQVLEERESSTVKAQNVWSQVYVDALVLRDRDAAVGGDLGKSGSGLDERLYAVQDANFNVTALVTAAAVVERYQYDPYGSFDVLDAEFSADSDGVSDVGWVYFHQGGRYDVSTELYNFRHRDYSPTLGRWVQPDPARYVDGLNLFASYDSRPTIARDPLGLDAGWAGKKGPPSPWGEPPWPPYGPPAPGPDLGPLPGAKPYQPIPCPCNKQGPPVPQGQEIDTKPSVTKKGFPLILTRKCDVYLDPCGVSFKICGDWENLAIGPEKGPIS